jgi:2-hydroxycyclohexanecarboxyl-CoA dehydrogenase
MGNRVALVTGGAQGIGRGITAALAEQGFRVAIADLNLETATQTAKDLSEAGGTVIAVEANVTDSASVRAAVAAVERELGPVEIAVNNAGWEGRCASPRRSCRA